MKNINEVVQDIINYMKSNGMDEQLGYENDSFTPGSDPYIYVYTQNISNRMSSSCTQTTQINLEFDYYVVKDSGVFDLNKRLMQLANIVNPLTYPYNPQYSINFAQIINGSDAGNGWFYGTLLINIKI